MYQSHKIENTISTMYQMIIAKIIKWDNPINSQLYIIYSVDSQLDGNFETKANEEVQARLKSKMACSN